MAHIGSIMRRAGWAALVATLLSTASHAQAPAPGATSPAQEAILLTVFMRHDQSRPLDELNAQLKRQDYYKKFPPEGIEVVSWYIVMGIGQVVTLRVPPARLREINRVIEQTAWGPYRTEFYPTYDYKAIAEEERRRNNQQ